jgi:Aminopeptidase N
MTTTRKNFRLPTHVVPSRYEITLRPDLKSSLFTGHEVIDVQVLAPTASIVINSKGLKFDSAYVESADGTRLAGRVSPDDETELTAIDFDGIVGAGQWKLTIEFSGVLGNKLVGFYRSVWTDTAGAENVIATTHFEPTHARKAFPCFDEPAMKAVFQINLEVDENLAAISNESVTAELPLPGGKKLVRFADTMLLPSYLVAFIIGNFVGSETVDVNGVAVRVWSTPDKAHLSSFALKAASFAVDFFEKYFEIRYPGKKIDHIAIPDFPIGAMENLGCITFRETALLVDEKNSSHASLARVAEVVMHELAHMWFGDLVTMRWWNGLWLKESFATFMSHVALDAWKPSWNIWNQFALSRAAAAQTDSLSTTHAIENPVHHPDDATSMFDIISYEKGCSVLYQLHEFVGAETFRKGCVKYLKAHSFGNTETHDLWDALAAAAAEAGDKTPVRDIMDAWVFTPGHPVLTVSTDEAAGFVVVSKRPFRLLATDTFAPGEEELPVPLILRVVRKDGSSHEKRLVLKGASETLFVGEDFDYVVANSGGSGFFRILYSEALSAKIAANLASLSVVERFNLVNDTWTMVRAGLASSTDYLTMVSTFGNEEDTNVWEVIVSSLEHLHGLVEGDAQKALESQIRELLQPKARSLGWVPAAGETIGMRKLRATMLRTLATVGNDTAVIEAAGKKFSAWKTDATTLDTELVPAVVSIMAHNGDAALYDEFNRMSQEAKTPQDTVRFLYALARFRDPALLARTIDLCLSDAVRNQDAPSLMATILGNDAGSRAAWEFIKTRFPEMTQRYPELATVKMCGALSALDTPELEAEVVSFFAATKVKAGDMAVAQMLERLRINVLMRERETSKLTALLSK